MNRDPVRPDLRRRTAAPLIAACLAAAAAAGPAAAADKPYFQEFREKSCPSGEVCVLDFSKIKAKRLARLTNVACLVDTQDQLKFLQMDILFGAAVLTTLTLKPFGTSENLRFIVANDRIAAFVEAGQRVRIRAEMDPGGAAPKAPGDGDPTTTDLSCHVAGSY